MQWASVRVHVVSSLVLWFCHFTTVLYSGLHLGVRSLLTFYFFQLNDNVTYDLVIGAEPCRKAGNFCAASRDSGRIVCLCPNGRII
jgi:hypothetical protein